VLARRSACLPHERQVRRSAAVAIAGEAATAEDRVAMGRAALGVDSATFAAA
jgi:hypothetical protein